MTKHETLPKGGGRAYLDFPQNIRLSIIFMREGNLT